MKFELSLDEKNNVILTVAPQHKSIFQKLLGASQTESLDQVNDKLAFAIDELRFLSEKYSNKEQLDITPTQIIMSPHLAASLSNESAQQLGLPLFTDLTIEFDAKNTFGSPEFRLTYEWQRNGVREVPHRKGAILETENGQKRIPIWLLEAIEIADSHHAGKSLEDDWEALARFRKKLEPGVTLDNSRDAHVSMTDFLSGLKVSLIDRFSISPIGKDDFTIIPFDGEHLREGQSSTGNDEISENQSEIDGINLKRFNRLVKDRGSLTAYSIQAGHFVVIEKSAKLALDVMARKQKASSSERQEFIKNPGLEIRNAVIDKLRRDGKLDGLAPDAEEELIERSSDHLFVETKEYSERVTGIGVFKKPDIGGFIDSYSTWGFEDFGQLKARLDEKSVAEIGHIKEDMKTAIAEGKQEIQIDNFDIPVSQNSYDNLEKYYDQRVAIDNGEEGLFNDEKSNVKDEYDKKQGPFVLQTKDNFDDLEWLAKLKPRKTDVSNAIPDSIVTPLKEHQKESLKWQIEAWKAGLPGILNADEQGLGKTLQTIAFLAWLKQVNAKNEMKKPGPFLVVAPTSLLENWQSEVEHHLSKGGLGTRMKLYGASINFFKNTGVKGKDTDSGEEKLNFEDLHQAIEEGRGHRYWFITTYTTMSDYQLSLAKIPFSAIIFDEIQTLKNPTTRVSKAASSMNADFRIGLTGTPIENSADDLWSIMDQLSPGTLNTLKEFRERYKNVDESNMAELHDRIFLPHKSIPPLALRRIKDQVAKDLPTKTRLLHPEIMPDVQVVKYNEARLEELNSSRGKKLKLLHHIRAVSVHPDIDMMCDEQEYIDASARLKATMEILRKIKAKQERALVFIEHLKMQRRFIVLVQRQFGLNDVGLINGETPIEQRQKIVQHFQRHLQHDEGFDLLVLSPRAAGTGLTLTAATHVIHLSRWWNPAVEEQCNDRIHRIGQQKPVEIHIPMAIHPRFQENSFDCTLHSLMVRKRHLASATLWPMGDGQSDVAALEQGMTAEEFDQTDNPIKKTMENMFKRDGSPNYSPNADGSYTYE